MFIDNTFSQQFYIYTVLELDSKHFATSTVRQMIHHDPLKRVSIEKVKNQFEPEVKKPDESVKNSKILAPPASYPRTPIQGIRNSG